ncbi:MAG: complex I subunit 1 family protein [Bacteroidota bacterium]
MGTFLFFLPLLLGFMIVGVYTERRIAAFIQNRMSPVEAGKYGLRQTVKDLLRVIQQERLTPQAVDRVLFLTAPVIIFVALFSGLSMLPLTSGFRGSTAEVGLFFIMAVVSLNVIGVLMSGGSFNNKYARYSALRSVSRMISYKIPLGLAVLCVVIISQSLDLQNISYQQGILASEVTTVPVYLFGIADWQIDVTNVGGVLSWNILRVPMLFFAFIIYFIASLAESNRASFDSSEAESELIHSDYSEYSGFRWALFMLSEHAMMLLMSFLGTILFLGSWNTPLPNIGTITLADWTTGEPHTWLGHAWGIFWLFSKTLPWIMMQTWVRWTYPQLRIDQLMNLCWKYLIPVSLLLVLFSGVWRLWML